MTAFECAIQAGADMIETDVHLTKDEALVLIHDDTVERTTDGKGNVADMTAEELFKLNAGDVNMPETIPYFEDVVKNMGRNICCTAFIRTVLCEMLR